MSMEDQHCYGGNTKTLYISYYQLSILSIKENGKLSGRQRVSVFVLAANKAAKTNTDTRLSSTRFSFSSYTIIHTWTVSKFRDPSVSRRPSGYWDIKTQKSFMDDLAKKFSIFHSFFVDHMDITSPHQWYNVSISQVTSAGGGGLIWKYNGSLLKTLQALYPEHEWFNYRFSRPHHITKGKYFSKTQHLLLQHLQSVSDEQVITYGGDITECTDDVQSPASI